MKYSPTTDRLRLRGFTLLELVIASSLSALLIAGLASSIHIASQSLDVATGSLANSRIARQALSQIHDDLQSAVGILAISGVSIHLSVPDRDGDGDTESILYSWGGSAGDPLTRAIDYSDPTETDTTTTLATDVQSFDLDWYLTAP